MTSPEQGIRTRQPTVEFAPARGEDGGSDGADGAPAPVGLLVAGVRGGAPLRPRGQRPPSRPGDRGPLRRHGAGPDTLGGTEVDAGIASALRRRRGSGDTLPESVSTPFADHFGHDLSAVRIHHDAEAGHLAGSLQASAFTHGNDIYFAPGAYRPTDAGGQHVIAHELSHVVAQRTGADRGGPGPLTVGQADDPAEAAADRSAADALAALRRTKT